MATFSAKHYEAIAGVLLNVRQAGRTVTCQLDYDAERLADLFERDNPAFNREHFLAVVRGEKPVKGRDGRSKYDGGGRCTRNSISLKRTAALRT